jgi:hypothetical protein
MALLTRWIAIALAALIANPASADDQQVISAIEAAYLTKFAPFVEWPANAAATALCVRGDDGIADLVGRALAAPSPSPVPFRRLDPGTPPIGCRILFAADPDPATLAMPALLTVTRQAADNTKGIVNFVIVDDRVRFEIDDAKAARQGLKISSKLLSLAVAVKPRA